MTNGAGNAIKWILLYAQEQPSGIRWAQFEHAGVGQKTRQVNKQLNSPSIKHTWTPVKPITALLTVSKTQSVHCCKKIISIKIFGSQKSS